MRTGPRALARSLAELVRIPSVNPAFGGEGEGRIAERVRERLVAAGVETHWHEPRPGRPSVVGRLPGSGGAPSLMLYTHLDTVGVNGMERPFEPRVVGDRLYGRGAMDMKGGLAAALCVVERLARRRPALRGDLLLACVADEEAASLGMAEVLRHHTADAAIVAEPTGLELVLAHNGFHWIEVEVEGRAAHGSLHAEGIDANLRMGRVLGRVECLARELTSREPHPLTGPPSMHAAVLEGGTGWSTYAARSTVRLERRTIPGEAEGVAENEIAALLDSLRGEDPDFHASARTVLSRPAWEARSGSPIADAVGAAATAVVGRPPVRTGVGYWMDAALLDAAGIDTVVLGAGGGGAHTPDEWADLRSVHALAAILLRAVERHCG